MRPDPQDLGALSLVYCIRMAFDDPDLSKPKSMRHYHGDTVRVLFITAAVIMLLAESTGAVLPLAITGTVIVAVGLVILAGITNPAQLWIHWCNAAMAIVNAYLFGTVAIEHFRQTQTFFDSSYFFSEVLAIIFLISVYFAVKTVRGLLLRPHLT